MTDIETYWICWMRWNEVTRMRKAIIYYEATIADYDESANTVKLKIRGLSEDNLAEKYIRMKCEKLKKRRK